MLTLGGVANAFETSKSTVNVPALQGFGVAMIDENTGPVVSNVTLTLLKLLLLFAASLACAQNVLDPNARLSVTVNAPIALALIVATPTPFRDTTTVLNASALPVTTIAA